MAKGTVRPYNRKILAKQGASTERRSQQPCPASSCHGAAVGQRIIRRKTDWIERDDLRTVAKRWEVVEPLRISDYRLARVQIKTNSNDGFVSIVEDVVAVDIFKHASQKDLSC